MRDIVTGFVVWFSLGFIFLLVIGNIVVWTLLLILAPLGAGIHLGGE